MKPKKWLTLFIIIAIGVSFFTINVSAQELRKAPKTLYTPPEGGFGYIPPPMDLSHIKVSPYLRATLQLPSSWDWRTSGGVSSVKNQNPYGTCWAFAAIGDIESKVLINQSTEFDYSELNIVACNPVGTTCDSGGNAWISTNYLTLNATVMESCDPYPGGCPNPTCVNPSCTFYKQVVEWHLIPNDVVAIKEAVMNYGPVNTAMYASFPGFSSYDGSYCLTYSGSEDPNHAVLIVGWDDDMCDGDGAWIVKNSWGTGWGDNGYFYIKYGDARIGSSSNVITKYKDYDPNETIYHYDEWGWWSSVGYGDGDDWGMVEFTPTTGDLLYSVDIWAVSNPTSYNIYIYDDFDGSSLSSLLVGPISGTVDDAGYYSIDLPSPLQLTQGDAIYIAVEFNTGSYAYPVPMDDSGPMETNKCYVSNNGSSWYALDNGNYAMGDVGIRARVAPPQAGHTCAKDGDPALYIDWGESSRDVYPGQSITYTLGPANFGHISSTCTETDTFCLDVTDTKGWGITGNPGLGLAHILDPGTYWENDVTINVPCNATPGEVDTVTAVVAYVDVYGACAPDCGDCEDPNSGYYSTATLVLNVVEAPPSLYVEQDSINYIDQGQTAAYIPFSICNGDPCASPQDYIYNITSKGHVGPAINTVDTVEAVPGGECVTVYGIIDAGSADICDYDTLTIIAWSVNEPVVYDTCVQIVHVVEPLPVPLFTNTMIIVVVVSLILISAVFIRRRARESA